MTSWMTLVDPNDHILKVSCHYLYFWLRYKPDTKRDKNVTEDRQTERQRDKETDRTGSSLTLWMYLIDPKNHILKVSCHYLYFWLLDKFVHGRWLVVGGGGRVVFAKIRDQPGLINFDFVTSIPE